MYNIVCTGMMRFEWDSGKNETNLKKHGIRFELAQLVFDDPFSITAVDRIVDGEERWQTIGAVEGILVVMVAHTYRDDGADEIVRIISARPATSHERRLYVEANR